MTEMQIERRLGEVVVIKVPNVISIDAHVRLTTYVKRCLENRLPLILDGGMEAEVICTPATMHADYTARFGDCG